MKSALLLPLLVLACVALASAEGHPRTLLAATPPRSGGVTPAASPPPQGTIATPDGPLKIGTVAAGNLRPVQGAAAAKGSTGSAKVNWSQQESCRSVGLHTFCGKYEQSNCCRDYSNGRFYGCVDASNLYTCTGQFSNRPIAVCCS